MAIGPRLELKNVSKRYGATTVIEDLTLQVAVGEFVVFVGPSGCGKSTLIRMIAGLEEISSGDLLIDGARVNEIGPADRGLAMVFQSYALYPHMTVRQNMGFALRLARVPEVERERKVQEAARILNLEPLLDQKPAQLSGGQRQRVAIGRAIVRHPKAFLFDEPLSNLDAALRAQMRIEIARLHSQLGTTTVYVTHDQIEAMTMAERIVVLRAGKVEQIGTPLEVYHRPNNLFVAGFIGSPRMNFLTGSVSEVLAGRLRISLPAGQFITIAAAFGELCAGASVTVGVRPEALTLGDSDELQGRVLLIEQLGAVTLVHLDVGMAENIIVQIPSTNRYQAGVRVGLKLDDLQIHLFDAQGQAIVRQAS